MCRADLCTILVDERIPSTLPLSRALRFQRYEQEHRNRQEERQSWANFISYLRARENEPNQTMQTDMQANHWMTDIMSGSGAAAPANRQTSASAASAVSSLAHAGPLSILAESASPLYGAIRHRRLHEEHVALNVQPRRRAAQNSQPIGASHRANANEHANALTDSVIQSMFTRRSRTASVSGDDEKARVANAPMMSEESSNVNVSPTSFVLVLVDELDEKKMDLTHISNYDSLALQQSFTVLQQQLNSVTARSVAVAQPAPIGFSSDYLDSALVVHNRPVEVAD